MIFFLKIGIELEEIPNGRVLVLSPIEGIDKEEQCRYRVYR
jgi:hypothetical protein